MTALLWRIAAWIVSRPRIAGWLIQRAKKTPYSHLPGYMNRYWLFNAYEKIDGEEITPIPWLPSIRIHHILRRDGDRHLHDHPWDARTIILKGYYNETRLVSDPEDWPIVGSTTLYRNVGDTAALKFGEYHSITEVSDGGVWTMFLTFGEQGTWGFLVDGKKIPWREYKALYPQGPWEEIQT